MELTQEQMELVMALAAAIGPVGSVFAAAHEVAEASRPTADAAMPILAAMGGDAAAISQATYDAIEAASAACAEAVAQIAIADAGFAQMMPPAAE